jgi:hypothetical protein
MKLVAISDVTLGYGTPQLPLLMQSLQEHLGGTVHIIEPCQPELAPKHTDFPDFQVLTVASADHPHSVVGRQEYIVRATREINRLQPDLLVICCTYTLPVLFQLRKRPATVIYYSVESIPFYGEFDVEMNRRCNGLVDVILFPEQNRAALETARCGFSSIPKVVLYNTSNRQQHDRPPLPAAERNGRILYAGTISRAQTFMDYYFSDKVRAMPIDMFGPVKGTAEDQQKFLSARGGDLVYRGRIGISHLAQLRRHYLYSIVAWNPDQEGQLYAAPNKFFEAIADGVPPIAAPHPQCKLLIERYGCGILLEDWSFDSFHAGLRRALRDAGTPRWQAMVDACRRAVQIELTWDAQFDKLKAHLNKGNHR